MLSEKERIKLDQMERRRGENDRAMWLAPVITMAAQTFLLQILTDPVVPCVGRAAVLLAGVAATLAACWTILRAHSREFLYSEAINEHAIALGLADVRPAALKRPAPLGEESFWRSVDRRLVLFADSERLPIAYMAWIAALSCFIIADVVVFLAV